MHFAMRFDVINLLYKLRFLSGENRTHFLQRPSEIVTIVVERVIRVLTGVKAPVYLIRQDFVNPRDDAFGSCTELWILHDSPSVQVVLQKLGIVVGHFFEVGDEPAFIDGIAMETAGELVVDAAASHFLEGGFGHCQEMLFFCLLVALEDEVDVGGVRDFGGAAEAAVFDVEELGDGFDLRVDDAEMETSAGSGEDFGLRDGVAEGVSGALEFGSLVAVGIGDGEKNAAETGAAHLVFGRKVGAAKKGLAVGEQKSGERPASLSGNGTDGGLIAGVDLG